MTAHQKMEIETMAKENDNFALHATGDEEAAMSSSAWQNIVGFDSRRLFPGDRCCSQRRPSLTRL